MGMIIVRWSLGLVVGCAAFGALLLPFPPTTPQVWAPAVPAALASEIGKLTRAAGEAQSAARRYRDALVLDRWNSASRSDTMLVRIDPTVPIGLAQPIRTAIAQQWAALGAPVSAARAEVFVYLDSTSIPRTADSAAARRVLEPRRLVDVVFALPPATDGRRCVSLVRLRGSSPAHMNALRSQPLIGVCGFFAAFGLPGDGIHSWLATTNYRLAARSDWSVPRAPAVDESSLYALSEPAARCLTGDRGACSLALGSSARSPNPAQSPSARLAWVLDPGVSPVSAATSTRYTLGGSQDGFLADIERSLGGERFRRFWRASASPDSAFVAAAGIELSEWTQQWLQRTYGAPPVRPSVRPRNILWLALLLPFTIVLAARPRPRVLAERLFARA